MSFIKKIEIQADLIERIAKAKEKLNYLSVTWETDTKEMFFGELYGGNPVLNSRFLRMDTMKVDPITNIEEVFDGSSKADIERMTTLIDFIESGVKVLPPICVDTFVVKDGVKNKLKSNVLIDGSLRLKVAAYLNVPEIPIVVFERINSYLFTPEIWGFKLKEGRNILIDGFSYTGLYLNAISIDGEVINIPNHGRGVEVDEGNHEYIEIQMM